ncbi:MAG: ABC transporter permease [Chloroflexota bacterium]
MRSVYFLVRRNLIGVLGGVVVLILLIIAIAPGLFAPYDPTEMVGPKLSPPDETYRMGTDRYGRDIWSRIAWGTRISFEVGFLSVLFAAALGVILGIVAGYFGGATDYLIMRVMDAIFAFPSVLLAIALVAIGGSALSSIILAITIVYIPIFARVARASSLTVKEREFVTAAFATGVGTPRILAVHILPNILSPIIVQMALRLSSAITVEAALSFLGLGAVPPTPTLGSMLSEGRAFMEISPWTVLYPGVALALVILGVNLFGDALRDMLDPRLRGTA